MANAKPSSPYSQAPSKMEINIPVVRGETIIKKADGSVVSRVEYTTGSARENILFAKDYPNALTVEEIEAKKEAPVPSTKTEGKSDKPKPPTRGKGSKGEK